MPKVAACRSYPISIFIAGDFEEALRISREFCDVVGQCVTVTPTSYIYTNGQESGVIVGLINYPRFPSTEVELLIVARSLAEKLLEGLEQQSYSIQTPDDTYWVSYRPEDNP